MATRKKSTPKRPPVSSTTEEVLEEHDDIDSVIASMKEHAHFVHSTPSILAMLEEPAVYEIADFDTLVLDEALLSEAAARGTLRKGLIPKLRAGCKSKKKGVQQRYLYALIRFEGAEAEEALAALMRDDAASQSAVLCALTDESEFNVAATQGALSDAFEAPLLRLLSEGKGHGEGAPSWRFFERPLVRAAMRLATPDRALMRIVEDVHLSRYLGEGTSRLNASNAADAEARFAEAAHALEHPAKGSLPDRRELNVAAKLARAVGRNAVIANRIAALAPVLVQLGRLGTETELASFIEQVSASSDLLSEEASKTLAPHLCGNYAPIFPLAASAWARLPEADAERLAKSFSEGTKATSTARWDAAARAFVAHPSHPAALGQLFVDYATPHNTTEALREALGHVKSDPSKLIQMIEKARDLRELQPTLEVAIQQRVTSVLRSVLLKLREGPFRIDKATEGLLAALVDDDNRAWLEEEIEGENPFRDRREALQRVAQRSLR